jgi:hypothetical protein
VPSIFATVLTRRSRRTKYFDRHHTLCDISNVDNVGVSLCHISAYRQVHSLLTARRDGENTATGGSYGTSHKAVPMAAVVSKKIRKKRINAKRGGFQINRLYNRSCAAHAIGPSSAFRATMSICSFTIRRSAPESTPRNSSRGKPRYNPPMPCVLTMYRQRPIAFFLAMACNKRQSHVPAVCQQRHQHAKVTATCSTDRSNQQQPSYQPPSWQASATGGRQRYTTSHVQASSQPGRN